MSERTLSERWEPDLRGDEPQPCGHPKSSIVGTTTMHCGDCAEPERLPRDFELEREPGPSGEEADRDS